MSNPYWKKDGPSTYLARSLDEDQNPTIEVKIFKRKQMFEIESYFVKNGEGLIRECPQSRLLDAITVCSEVYNLARW